MPKQHFTPRDVEFLARLGSKYLWWKPIAGGSHPPDRILAQIMNLGTYEDIRRLEAAFGPEQLAEALRRAEPGWFTPRSWEFWRGRLSVSGIDVLDEPPKRTFRAAAL
jgi:hypothetical protein